MKYCFLLLLFSSQLVAQTYYYPPNNSDEWATINPEDLGWCTDRVDSLYQFLEAQHTKGFIILKEGNIVLEQYFDDFTQESNWYWASAGKSLVATLIGIAQAEGALDINDTTSDYLGEGWTSATTQQEAVIKIKHQLSMTTGLSDFADDPNCLTADCLEYLQAPGERWAYYNAPYRLLQDVLSNTSGLSINAHTNQKLGNDIGLSGLWINHVFWSNARGMARFGHLILTEGMWDGELLLTDQSYFQDMINPSQSLNPSYGYLWWLNGKGQYQVPAPGFQININEDLVPNAPADAFAALGKNDQKIYVVPSLDMVVVRVGDKAFEESLAVSAFDNALWQKINELACTVNTSDQSQINQTKIYPNPTSDNIQIETDIALDKLVLFNQYGQRIHISVAERTIFMENLPKGIYFLSVTTEAKQQLFQKIIKI